MKLTLQIAQLIKTNEDLQKEIDELQSEALQFSENLKMQLQQKLQDQNGTSDLHDENKWGTAYYDKRDGGGEWVIK